MENALEMWMKGGEDQPILLWNVGPGSRTCYHLIEWMNEWQLVHGHTALFFTPDRRACCCIPSWNRPYWAIPYYITNVLQKCPRGTVFWNYVQVECMHIPLHYLCTLWKILDGTQSRISENLMNFIFSKKLAILVALIHSENPLIN